MDTKALKVKIKRNGKGQAVYPNFQSLAAVGNEDWSRYVDREGLGWLYDKTSGHDDDDVDSPRGIQYGVLVVDPEFADEALEKFPDDCEALTNSQVRQFYQNKVVVDEHEDELDEEVLKNTKNELDLLKALPGTATFPSDSTLVSDRIVALESQILEALDPNGDKKGVRKNKRKRWNDFRQRKGITVIDPVVAAPASKAKRKVK